jgi:hypothetical protein
VALAHETSRRAEAVAATVRTDGTTVAARLLLDGADGTDGTDAGSPPGSA